MKITLISKEFFPQRGGAERYAASLASTLTQLQNEVHVVSSRFAAHLPEKLQTHLAPSLKGLSLLSPPWAMLLGMRKVLSQIQSNITYALTLYYPVDMYRAGDGVLKHWLYLKYPHFLPRMVASILPKKWIALDLEKRLYTPGNFKIIVTNSRLVKKHIIQYYSVPEEKIEVIYNGVDKNLFFPQPQEREKRKKQWNIPENALLILFVAHNWERKGLDTLLKGACKLLQNKEAVVVVVGRGKISRWQNFLKTLNISQGVYFFETTPNIVEWYQTADVLVLPTHYDPFANVCLEAMACGIPVITSLENGACELIQPGQNGYVLSSLQAYQELEGQLACLRKEDMRTKLGEQALATSLLYPLEKNAQETLRVCNRIFSN